MRFRATVVTAPEFELPDYKEIPVQLPDTKISEAEVEAAIERLRDQSADFVDVPERELQMGDFAVLDFEGFDRKQGDQRNRAAKPARSARRQKILAASGAPKIFCQTFASN